MWLRVSTAKSGVSVTHKLSVVGTVRLGAPIAVPFLKKQNVHTVRLSQQVHQMPILLTLWAMFS